jgi:hypothetical protein
MLKRFFATSVHSFATDVELMNASRLRNESMKTQFLSRQSDLETRAQIMLYSKS